MGRELDSAGCCIVLQSGFCLCRLGCPNIFVRLDIEKSSGRFVLIVIKVNPTRAFCEILFGKMLW